MNVAYINAVCGTGSTGSICEDLATGLIDKGHHCTIYYGNGDSENPIAKRMISNWAVKYHAMFSRISGWQGYASVLATYKLINQIKKKKFDIVHLHNLHGNFINVPMLLHYLKKNEIPTVITLHDCWFYTGKCTHYTECGCYKWMDSCGNCPQLKKDIPSYFFDKTEQMLNEKKKLYDSFDRLGIIAVSEWIKGEAEKSILKNNNIVTIYNWVDLKNLYPRNNKNGKFFTILGVSAKWTNNMPKLRDFIKIAQMLPENIRIQLIGKMDSNVILPMNVSSIPYVEDQNELANYYSKADVYVHLSREDSFGKVIIEAMACGTPVVVYDSTACPELVKNGCGYVVDVGNVNEICKRVLQIREIGSEYFKEACVSSAKKFEKNLLIEKTYKFYEVMIKHEQ